MSERSTDDIVTDINDAFASACSARSSSRALLVAIGVFEELAGAIKGSDLKRDQARDHFRLLAISFSSIAFSFGLSNLSEEVFSVYSNRIADLIKSSNPKTSSVGLELAREFISRCNMWLGSEISYQHHFVSDIFTLQFYVILKAIGLESPYFSELFRAYRNSLNLILLTADTEASARGITFMGDLFIQADKLSDPARRQEHLRELLGSVHRMLWGILGPSAHGSEGNKHGWRVKRHAITALNDYPKFAIELNVGQFANDCLYLFADACQRDPKLLEACRYRLIEIASSVIRTGANRDRHLYAERLFQLIRISLEDTRGFFQVQNIVGMAELLKATVEVRDQESLAKLLEEISNAVRKVAKDESSYYGLCRIFVVATFVFLCVHDYKELAKTFLAGASSDGKMKFPSDVVRQTVKEYFDPNLSDDTINSVLTGNFRKSNP